MTEETYLTSQQAARFLGVTRQTLWRWRAEGFGPTYIKPGRWFLYPLSELALYKDEHTVTRIKP